MSSAIKNIEFQLSTTKEELEKQCKSNEEIERVYKSKVVDGLVG